MYQASYKDDQIKALVDKPQNRESVARNWSRASAANCTKFSLLSASTTWWRFLNSLTTKARPQRR
jgi:hypothetical protein